MISTNSAIAVYGATGHTGHLVAAEVARRGHPLLLGGRNATALASLAEQLDADTEVITADLDDPHALRKLTGAAGVVINCAGPYSRTGVPLADAAVATGCHYLGHAAEPLHIKQMYDAYAGADTVVIPGMSFYGGLGDLLAAAVAEGMSGVEEIVVAHAVTGWRMTAASKAVATELADADTVTYTDGRLSIGAQPRDFGTFTFPSPVGRRQVIEDYPAGEVITIPRSVPVRAMRVVMTTETFGEQTTFTSEDATPAERAQSTFTLVVHAKVPGHTRCGWIRGNDIYGTGALIATEAASRLVQDEHTGPTGALGAAQAFTATDFLTALSDIELHLPEQHPATT